MIRRSQHRLSFAIATVGAGLIGASPAVAQEPEQVEAKTLDTMVVVAERAVTATKTETPLMETPQAISVVPADLFTARGARNLQETLRYTAGVTAEAFGLDTRGENIFVRGLSPTQYLDGMRRVYNFSPIPRTDVYTLERVEVLRGPSAVLYGQGASGGIINAVSKSPKFSPAGEVALQVGSFDRKQLQTDITGALGDSGTVAGRVVALVRDSGMQTDKLPNDRVVFAPSLTWLIGERTRLTLLGLYQSDHTASSQQFLPVAATLLAPEDQRLDPSTFLGDTGYDKLDARQASVTAQLEHRFNDDLTWRSNLRYLDADTTFQEVYPDVYSNPDDPFIDADNRVVNRFAYAIKPHIRTLTLDNSLQYEFQTGAFRHRVLAGVDYTDFRQESSSAFGTVTPIDVYDPHSTGVIAPAYSADPDQRNTQLGVYLQDQVRYADRVSLVIGVRRDRARSRTGDQRAQTDTATTYRIGAIGEVVDGVSPYASYSESFLPVAGLDFDGDAFMPVRGQQVEVGVKWAPIDDALLTANVYRVIESNRPTNDPDNVLNVIQTGEIRSRGIELEGAVEFDNNLVVTASYSHNDAEVTRSTFKPEVGVPLSDVPADLASLWLGKGFAVGSGAQLRVGLGGRYVGSTLSTSASGSLRTPSYALVDALVSLRWSDWQLALNATNLLDKEYYAPCRAFGDCFTGNTRNVTATLAYHF